MTTVFLEIIPVTVQHNDIHYINPTGYTRLDSFEILHQSDCDPMQQVKLWARGALGITDLEVLHSTSWRYDRREESIRLTFLIAVNGEDRVWPFPVIHVEGTQLVRGTATEAPAQIEFSNVLHHALRHLAFLMKTDPEIGANLKHWETAMRPFEVDLAGGI